MKIYLGNLSLDSYSKQEIERLLSVPQNGRSDLEQMWHLMDKVWNEFDCDNKNLDWEQIGKFYSHPVWLLNGLFIEQHALSMQHREAISDWVISKKFNSVVDYGGGFGTIAKLIAKKNHSCKVYIYEPHPSEFAVQRFKDFDNISIIKDLNVYDCLISTDVLEHVPDPLVTFSEMIDSVKIGGSLIIANNFTPVIKCHLPQTFHLRYTFGFFAQKMGLKIVGRLEGSHATIYEKMKDPSFQWSKLRKYELLSKYSYPVIEKMRPLIRPIKRIVQ